MKGRDETDQRREEQRGVQSGDETRRAEHREEQRRETSRDAKAQWRDEAQRRRGTKPIKRQSFVRINTKKKLAGTLAKSATI